MVLLLNFFPECAGCKTPMDDGQALVALDRNWHVWCFKCGACKGVLHGEYLGRDGVPYCERDFQRLFGVKCNHCARYISGKVLQVHYLIYYTAGLRDFYFNNMLTFCQLCLFYTGRLFFNICWMSV